MPSPKSILTGDHLVSPKRVPADVAASHFGEIGYRTIFESAPDSVFLVAAGDQDPGRILDANDVACASHGYSREELQNLRISDLDTPESARLAQGRIRQIMAGEIQRFEVRHFRKDGTEFPMEVTARAVEIAGRPCILSFNRDISERQRVDAALRLAESRWRFALDGAGDGIWDWNVETGAVFYSPRWKSMLGYAEHELGDTVETWRTLVHPEDFPAALAIVEKNHRGESEQSLIEHRMRCKDGSWKWVRARGKVIEWGAPGRPRRMIGTHADIDESRRLEEADRTLTERLNLAMEAGRFGLFQLDLGTDWMVWDDRAYEIFGLTRRGTGPTHDEITAAILPEYHDVWREALAAPCGREAIAYEVMIRHASGELRNVVCRAVIRTAANGGGGMMTGVFDDITERRRSEEERSFLLERYDSVFHSISEGLALHLLDGQVIDCNPAAERILGLTRLQFLGRDPFDARWRAVNAAGEPISGADHPPMVVARTDRPVRNFLMWLDRRDGGRVWLTVNAEPVRDSAGRMTHVVSSFTDITAQRMAEEESRRANERLQAAVVASRIVWWDWEVAAGDFKISSFGQPCILGYTAEQLANVSARRWLELTHPEDRPTVKIELEAALAGKTDSWSSRHRLLAADGTWRWVRHTGRVRRRAPDGTALAMAGVTQDQHEHYDAEARAQTSAERLRIALSASAMGVWRYNLQTGAAEWDERQRELFGLSQTAAAPTLEEFLAMLVPEDQGVVKAAWSAVGPETPNFEYAFRIVLPRGGMRHIRCVGTMRFDEAGHPDWATGINEDVTEERQQALAMGELNGRLQMALRAAHFGVWEIDLATRRVTWDDALYGMYGVSPQEFGSSLDVFRTLVHPADRERVFGAGEEVLAGASERAREFRIVRRKDGAERKIEAISYIVRDAAGKALQLVGLDRDVTEQREAETKQRDLEGQLIQAQKLETLGTLAGGIAHDFNNLLTGVLGFIDLSLHVAPAGTETAEYLRNAREGSLRARDLVKRLLMCARRAPATARQPVHLGQLVVETLPLLTASLPASIVIRTQMDPKVGPVLADAGQLQQVLMNLCVNAAHAIGVTQGSITVELGWVSKCPLKYEPSRPGPYARLAVADTGCGMDAATQARVFDPFFTTKDQGEGTGLGLSIVHGIVHEHGGCIGLQSSVGVGTSFEIFLPLGEATPPVPVAVVATPHRMAGAGRRVLLADDEGQVRLVVGAVLKRAGFAVDACADGSTAAGRFAAAPESFALAVLDLSMPGRTGLELIAEFRARQPRLPIILMSGDHERYGHKNELGGPDVVLLSKPFSLEELQAALERALVV